MKIHRIHSWDDISIADAKKLQIELASRIVLSSKLSDVKTIAAGDLAFSKNGVAYAAVIVLSYPDLQIMENHAGFEKVRFPYVPGLLSFREAPLLLKLFEKLSIAPDIVMIDGQGIAHPRSFGIASHIGLFLKIPTIGIAKSRLIGEYAEPEKHKGSWSPLMHNGGQIGVVVRTRSNVTPVFASPGNMLDFENCLKWTMNTTRRYRIPEPTRQAHIAVEIFKRDSEGCLHR